MTKEAESDPSLTMKIIGWTVFGIGCIPGAVAYSSPHGWPLWSVILCYLVAIAICTVGMDLALRGRIL